ncbi:sulfotransferase family protein [Novosphingobium aerophilum]|nr:MULTISPECIES: sulfotransferase [unclassified Novosphingobium]TCM33048.1 sulfotransferase family protein [Novosphingobium sp. ST904]WRT94916.1 sulfotransferase [Novosphingobium sp. RL4]
MSTDVKKDTETVRTSVFRVEQFRDPQISPERRAELEAAEAEPLDMTVEGVLAEAAAQTGLSDFGPMDFTERLGALLGEVSANGNLWRFAKAQFRAACVKQAANRLKNKAFLDSHPGVEDEVIDRPIIIVGLPRSGTTHLENLIAADRRLRHLPVYLGSEAVLAPGETAGPDGLDPRWTRSAAHWDRMKQNAIMAAMHEHSPDHACGENELQMPDFTTYQWEWMAEVPAWRDYLLRHDQTQHYAYGKRMLKAIAHQFPSDRRWILKGNQHSEQLPALVANYPDAYVVQIHRDPLALLQSVLTMRGLSVLVHQKHPQIQAHVAYWVDRIEQMLRAYLRDMDRVPEGRRLDILFADVIADDIGTAQKVLEFAGLPSSAESVGDMRGYMDSHPRGKDGRVVYDLAGDFNLDIPSLRQRFAFYTDRFPVKQEVK